LDVESEINGKVPNRWSGRKWLLIGDSISTEKEFFVTEGYGTYVAKSLNLNKTNIAVSGKTMSWGYNIIDSQSDDFDLVTVMLGTNNQGYNTGIGSLNDQYYLDGDYSTNNSFYAATQLFYEKLRRKYPKAVIAFITPIKRANEEGSGGGSNEPGGDSLTNVGGYNTNALGLTTEPYAEAVKKVCQWYSIPCIDIFNTIDPRTKENRTRYFYGTGSADGTHPNSLGHALFIAPVIEAELLRCAPYFNVVDSWEFETETEGES
jgi:lysophospholipase L1-like esterase